MAETRKSIIIARGEDLVFRVLDLDNQDRGVEETLSPIQAMIKALDRADSEDTEIRLVVRDEAGSTLLIELADLFREVSRFFTSIDRLTNIVSDRLQIEK